jgi:hypothetical protein
MLKFKIGIRRLEFDKHGYHQSRKAVIEEVLKEAAREFLKAAIPLIPVWTGQARGAFRPLARAVGAEPPEISYKKGRRPKPSKNPETGETYAEGPDITIEKKGSVSFKYKINLRYVGENELKWKAIATGRNAFHKYIKENLRKRLPKIRDWLTDNESRRKGFERKEPDDG